MSKCKEEVMTDDDDNHANPVVKSTDPPAQKKMKHEAKAEEEEEEEVTEEVPKAEDSLEESEELEESETDFSGWYGCDLCLNMGPMCGQCGDCGSDSNGYFLTKMKSEEAVKKRFKTLRALDRLEAINIQRDNEGLSEIDDFELSSSDDDE